MPEFELEKTKESESTDLATVDEEYLSDQRILEAINKAKDKEELEKQFDLFNLSLSKKNAAKVIQTNRASDKAFAEIERRLNKRASNISNKELLEMYQVLNAQAERSQKIADIFNKEDVIKPVGNPGAKTDVTVNIGTDLDKDGKENVISVFREILKMANNQNLSEETATILPDLNAEAVVIDEQKDDEE